MEATQWVLLYVLEVVCVKCEWIIYYRCKVQSRSFFWILCNVPCKRGKRFIGHLIHNDYMHAQVCTVGPLEGG